MKNKKHHTSRQAGKIQKADIVDKKSDRQWLYSEIVKDHFLKPRNILVEDEENYKFDGKGTSGNPVCGDVMTVWIKVDPKTQKIKECKWRTYGCASAIASTSMMSVVLTEKGGMPLKQASKLTPHQIVKRLACLPPLKFHCSILGLDALKQAINGYLRSQGKS